MAFYFALFNVSNVNFERPRGRYHRSSSPRRRRRQLPDETSGALHDYRLLPRPRILGNQPPRPPTPPLPRNRSSAMQLLDVPGPATLSCLSSLHSGRCVASKRVTFEEHSLRETLPSSAHSVPFLDVREASMSEVNGNPTINSDTAARARMDRHVFEKVALWAATGEVTVARRRTVNTFQDDTHSRTVNVEEANPRKENETREECCLVSSRCSEEKGRARAAVFNSMQNVENELIEHRLMLTAPTRRRLWRPSSLLRRRSTSDKSIRYGWSYLNAGFRFAEEEPSDRRLTVSFTECQRRRPHFETAGDICTTATSSRSVSPRRGAPPHTPPLTWKRALRRLNNNQQLRSLSTPTTKVPSRMSILI